MVFCRSPLRFFCRQHLMRATDFFEPPFRPASSSLVVRKKAG
jgi:hypothetical protein